MNFSINLLIFVIGYFSQLSFGISCDNPEIKSHTYSTSDSQISAQTVIVVDFELKCDDSKNLNLYAELNGRTIPITKHLDSDSYQVSFSGKHKKIPKGVHQIRFFNDQLYNELRKAQRAGADTANIKHLFAVDVSHPGASNESWLQADLLAALLAVSISYYAYTKKSQIQA